MQSQIKRGRSMRSFSAKAIHVTLTLVNFAGEKKYAKKCLRYKKIKIIKINDFIRYISK